MAITWHNKPSGTLGSNKAPNASQNPDPNLFKHEHQCEDGRKIWVSIPLPDRLSFVTWLAKADFNKGKFGGEGGLAAAALEFAENLAAAQAIHGSGQGHGYFNPNGSKVAAAQLSLGPRGSAVLVTITKTSFKDQSEPAFSLRIECNPRKLQPQGFQELCDVLIQAAPHFLNLAALFAKAQIRRLDVATDLAGVTPGELIVRSRTYPTKTVTYRGPDSHLETVQLHRHKKPPTTPPKKRLGPLGKLELKVYDRNRQRAAMAKPPTYPGVQVTRLEVVQVRFKSGFGLADLSSLPDAFGDVLVRDRDSAVPNVPLTQWRAYVSCRRDLDAPATAACLSLDKHTSKYLENVLGGVQYDLLPASHWDEWGTALEMTGLLSLIEMAQANEA